MIENGTRRSRSWGKSLPRIYVGFDVDIGPLFQTPAEAKQAIENDVHLGDIKPWSLK
jgi:hypothetical protein